MMTTPLIEMPLAVETPGIAAVSVLAKAETVRAGVDFAPQPSPEAVAHFQAAMAEPLSENARAGRLLADAVQLTQTSIVSTQTIQPPETPVANPSAEEPFEVASETARPPVEASVKLPTSAVQTNERSTEPMPKGNEDAKPVAKLPQIVVVLPPKGSCKPTSEAPAQTAPAVPLATPPVAPAQTAPAVPLATPPVAPAQTAPAVPPATAPVAPAQTAPAVPSAMAPVSPAQTAPAVPSAMAPKAIENPVVDVSLPPSIARISVVVAGEIVRDVIAMDQPLETPRVPEQELVRNAGVQNGAIQELDQPDLENRPAKVEVVETAARPVRVETTSKTETTVGPIRVNEELTAADTPDAERLVAAGVSPIVAGTQTTTEVMSVKEDELVAPIAALSAKDRIVRTDVLVEAATAVADALLVSPGLMRGEGEVLVQLKPEVLDGSQIRISVQGQIVGVVFQTPTEQLTQLLTVRLPELQQHLMAALPTFSFKVGVVQGGGRWSVRKDVV